MLYVATATVTDDEMAERIALHRARRPATWRTLEIPTGLAVALSTLEEVNTVVVEDLTLLLSNYMERDSSTAEENTLHDVQEVLNMHVNVVLVSNEVGMGVVPPYPLGRAFRDALGRVNQAAAAQCGEAYFIVAGLPLRIK